MRLLLRFEVSYSESAEMLKQSYVDVAYKDFTLPNRKQTYSRVSVITGIPRKEVVRIREAEPDDTQVQRKPLNRAAQVLSGWLSDDDYCDARGEAMELPLRGELPSFETLVEKYSGDITARAILDELVRVGAVEKSDNNKVRLLSKGYVPENDELETLTVVSQHFQDLLGTGLHNIDSEPKDRKFQRQVAYNDIPETLKEEFRLYCHEKSLELLLDFNHWLSHRKEQQLENNNEATHRVGVGVYFFNKENNENEK